jgi:HSP20 family protein
MIRAELPGVEKKDIHVNVENNVLTIRGEKQIRTEDTKKHRIESSYGSFIRSFTLPTTVAADNIEAKFLNGILNLNIPKAIKDEKPEFEVKIT